MSLIDQLLKCERSILAKWLKISIDKYPQETKAMFNETKDPFANPVGWTVPRTMSAVLKTILSGPPPYDLEAIVDPVMRINAAQDILPSQAVEFVFALKGILRSQIESCPGNSKDSAQFNNEWLELDLRVDEIAKACFDIYMRCREQINAIKIRSVRIQTSGLLRMAGLAQADNSEKSNSKWTRQQ